MYTLDEPYETRDYKGYTIKIMLEDHVDEMDNPRADEPIGTMTCFHRNYRLGDEHGYSQNDFKGWNDERKLGFAGLLRRLRIDLDIIEVRPLYLYDHSGITISHHPFSCPWDSGQVGWHFITKQNYRKVFGGKRVSKKARAKVKTILDYEIENYDSYLCGEIYWVQVTGPYDWEDTCHGFLGANFERSGILDFAKHTVEAHIKELMK